MISDWIKDGIVGALLLIAIVFISGCVGQTPEQQTINKTGLNVTNYTAVGFANTTIVFNTTYPLLAPNIRWNHMPITVYFDVGTGKSVLGFNQDNLDYVRQAMQMWESKTNGVISFVETTDRDKADVIVKWVPVQTTTTGDIVGEGRPIFSDTGLFNLITNGELGLYPSPSRCDNVGVAIHEFGHVLGLAHTDNIGDIMYPYFTCSSVITKGAIDKLNELYKIDAIPDLTIVNATVSKYGNYIDIDYIIINQGLTTSPWATVRLEIDGTKVKDFNQAPLQPGYLQESIYTEISVLQSFKSIRLTIDPDNSIKEIFENNNNVDIRPQ